MTAETTETTEETTTTETEETTQTAAETTAVDGRLPDDHPVVKALAKANEEAKQARLKVKKFEDRDKTENQRLADQKSEAEQSAAEARAEAARLRAAVKYGLEEDDLDLLGTGTDDEIDARAQRLSERIAPKGEDEKPKPTRRPKERLKVGAVPNVDAPDVKPGMARLRAAYDNASK